MPPELLTIGFFAPNGYPEDFAQNDIRNGDFFRNLILTDNELEQVKQSSPPQPSRFNQYFRELL